MELPGLLPDPAVKLESGVLLVIAGLDLSFDLESGVEAIDASGAECA